MKDVNECKSGTSERCSRAAWYCGPSDATPTPSLATRVEYKKVLSAVQVRLVLELNDKKDRRLTFLNEGIKR